MTHAKTLGLCGEVVLVPGAPGVLELVAGAGGRVVEPLLEGAVAEPRVGLLLAVLLAGLQQPRVLVVVLCLQHGQRHRGVLIIVVGAPAGLLPAVHLLRQTNVTNPGNDKRSINYPVQVDISTCWG